MPRLTTVTFDLWQTLILDSPELGRPRARLRLEGARDALRAEGYDFPLEHLVEAYRRCQRVCGEVRDQARDVSFDEQIEIFLREIDDDMAAQLSPETRDRVARRYADAYLERPPRVDAAAQSVLHALRDRGYRLGLICNTGATPGATQREFLRRQGLAQFFDTLTFSDEERLAKPAVRIFHATLERLGASPAEAVHVGDHPRNDVEGAKRAGMAAVWLQRDAEEPTVAPDARIVGLEEAHAAVARLDG